MNFFLEHITDNRVVFCLIGLLVGIVIGICIGWFLKSVIGCKHHPGLNSFGKQKRTLIMCVNIIIVILWTMSVGNTIFQFTDAQTPIFLHAMMGAVMGYLNESFGDWILKMLGRDKKKEDLPLTKK